MSESTTFPARWLRWIVLALLVIGGTALALSLGPGTAPVIHPAGGGTL